MYYFSCFFHSAFHSFSLFYVYFFRYFCLSVLPTYLSHNFAVGGSCLPHGPTTKVCVCACAHMGPILIQALSVGPPLILIKEQMHYPCPVCHPLLCMCVCACVCLSCFHPACPCHVPLLSHIVPRAVSVMHMEDELVVRREKGRASTQPVLQIG